MRSSSADYSSILFYVFHVNLKWVVNKAGGWSNPVFQQWTQEQSNNKGWCVQSDQAVDSNRVVVGGTEYYKFLYNKLLLAKPQIASQK